MSYPSEKVTSPEKDFSTPAIILIMLTYLNHLNQLFQFLHRKKKDKYISFKTCLLLFSNDLETPIIEKLFFFI